MDTLSGSSEAAWKRWRGSEWVKDWTVWLKGIAAAVIGGGASAAAAAVAAPQVFTASRDNLEALLRVAAVAAVLNAAAYLKRSPLPAAELEK